MIPHDLAKFAAAEIPLVGISLLHFIWQGLLVALALKLILNGIQRPGQRYFWAMTALVVMALTPVATFIWLSQTPRPIEGLDNLLIEPLAAPLRHGWQSWLVGGWAAGVLVLSLRAAFGLRALAKLRRRSKAVGEVLIERFAILSARMAPGWRVNFRVSRDIDSPVVIGWLRPVVLLPLSVITKAPVEELEALVLHELAHVRRWDAFANAFQLAIEALLFYHPAVWWASRVARDERENCCDDLAVAATGDPAGYVRALANMAQARRTDDFALGAAGGALLQRARRQLIAVELSPQDLHGGRAMAAAALLTLTALASSMIGKGQPVQALMSLAQPVRQLSRVLAPPPAAAPEVRRTAPEPIRVQPAPLVAAPVPPPAPAGAIAPSSPSISLGPNAPATNTPTALVVPAAAPAPSQAFERAGRIYQQIAVMRAADQAFDDANSQVKDREAALDKTLKQVASLANALIYSQPDQLNSSFLSDRTTPGATNRSVNSSRGALPIGSARKQVDQAKLVAYLDSEPIGKLAKDQEDQLAQAQQTLQAAAVAQQAAHDELAVLTSE